MVTMDAERYQVLLVIVSELTPGVDVMNVEFVESPATLATPAVPL